MSNPFLKIEDMFWNTILDDEDNILECYDVSLAWLFKLELSTSGVACYDL